MTTPVLPTVLTGATPLLDGQSLSQLLAARTVPHAKVLLWATEIADAVARLHARGSIYGAMSADNVRIREGHAVLSISAPKIANATQLEDTVQFGRILRDLLAVASSDAEPQVFAALEQLAQQYLDPQAPVADMRKIAIGLKLIKLRPSRRLAAPPAIPAAPPEPAVIEAPVLEIPVVEAPSATPDFSTPVFSTSVAPKRKMLLVLRVVPPREQPVPRARKRLSFWLIFWLLVSAGAITAAAGGALFYFLR